MSDLEAVASSGQKGSRPAAKARSGPDCILVFCRIINAMTGISALLCLVAHAMALSVGPPLTAIESCKIQVLRLYGLLLAALLALVETEWQWLLTPMRALENWLVRGLLQGFLCTLTVEVATSEGDSDFDKSLALYRNVSGLCILGCACFYILGGMLCFGALKQARYKRHVERMKVERNLKIIEQQREELQQLLAGYSKD